MAGEAGVGDLDQTWVLPGISTQSKDGEHLFGRLPNRQNVAQGQAWSREPREGGMARGPGEGVGGCLLALS